MIDIERSALAPASLARGTSCTERDVREALHRDFFGKCYLCERKLSLGDVHVEHRRPRAQWPEGTYHWPNLFPACAFCNGRRARTYPEVGLLSPGDGVERRIVQLAEVDRTGTAIECEFVAADPNDERAKVTAEELQRLHSGGRARSHRARFATRDLLDTIHDHFLERVHPVELQVRRARKRGQLDADAETRLRAALSRRAPFTMLVRSLVHPGLHDLFD